MLFLSAFTTAQNNLIPNGDFEIYVDCPIWYNDLDSAYAWSNPMTNIPTISGTPDFFHECANYPVGMPSNFQGYQYAHSKWAYAGIYLKEGVGANADHREYLQTYFTSPLVAGNCYHFEMYVNLSNNCRFTTDDIAVRISNTFLSGINNQDPLLYLPSIVNLEFNTFDTLNWTLVSGDYEATGGEMYLVIGNFKTDLQTSTIVYNPSSPVDYIYCYIDDVSLKTCQSTTSISSHTDETDIKLYPNPSSNFLNIEYPKSGYNFIVEIHDYSGKMIECSTEYNSAESLIEVDTKTMKEGIYLVTIKSDSRIINKKFVKQ